jgi:hypothetical protein
VLAPLLAASFDASALVVLARARVGSVNAVCSAVRSFDEKRALEFRVGVDLAEERD